MVTDVRIRLLNTDTKLKAVASITIQNAFVIHDIKIIKARERTFLGFPSRKLEDEFVDIAHPISKEARDLVETAVFDAYERALVEVSTDEDKDA
jgi:stage V sporulation protein G